MEVASQQTHLNKKEQANQLVEKVLEKCSIIFDGELGCYLHKKITLDMPQDAWSIQRRSPHPIAYQQEHIFMKEIEVMVKDGVLWRKHRESEWASPT